MSTRVVKIFVMNDFACHFCYIGHYEFMQAIKQCQDTLHLPLSFEVEYRPFRLIGCFKELPPGLDRAAFYLKKMGKDQFDKTSRNLEKWSKESGVPISFNGPISQTLRAHRLTQKAFRLGGQRYQLPLLSAIFKAYFTEQKDISDINVLAGLAEEVGMMTKDEAVRFLESKELEDEIASITEEARAKGISGVPVYVIDGKWVVKGSQSASVFVEIFKKLARGPLHQGNAPIIPQLTTTTQCC